MVKLTVMPQALPKKAAASAPAAAKRPREIRKPEKTSSVSSGTGNPAMPNTSRPKMAK